MKGNRKEEVRWSPIDLSTQYAFAESGRWEQAESFLKHFGKQGIKPNLQTFDVLIKVACKRKHFEHAKRLLDSI